MLCWSGFGRSVHLTIIIIIIIIIIISNTTVATDTIFATIINAWIRRMYSTCENPP